MVFYFNAKSWRSHSKVTPYRFSSQAAHTSFCAPEREEIIDLQDSLRPFIISENVSLPSGSLLAQQIFFPCLNFLCLFIMFVCVCVHYAACAEVRWHLRQSFLKPPTCWSRRRNSDRQAWWQVPSSAEPSHLKSCFLFFPTPTPCYVQLL